MEEQNAQIEDRFFRGPQIAYMIYDMFSDYFRVTSSHESIFDLTDLMSLTPRGVVSKDLIVMGEVLSSITEMLNITPWKVCTR